MDYSQVLQKHGYRHTETYNKLDTGIKIDRYFKTGFHILDIETSFSAKSRVRLEKCETKVTGSDGREIKLHGAPKPYFTDWLPAPSPEQLDTLITVLTAE